MSKRKLPDLDSNLNQDFCELLSELAEYEKNVSRNMFKYKAYRQAAETLSKYHSRITSGTEAQNLPGVGKKIAQKIDEFIQTGKLTKLETIRGDSASIAINTLTKVSGIGPAKASQLFDCGIKSISDLECNKELLNHHQVVGLKFFNDFQLKIPRQEISNIEIILKNVIMKFDSGFLVTICGSYRRGCNSSGDIDCLLSHPEFTSKSLKNKDKQDMLKCVVTTLEDCHLVIDTLALGETKFMGVCRYKDNPARRLDIRLTPLSQYYCGILYFTGSDLFNRNIRACAQEKGFILNEYSLRPIGITGVPGDPVPLSSEKEIFEYIEYPFKEPNKRNL